MSSSENKKKRTFSGANDYEHMDDDWIDEETSENALMVRTATGKDFIHKVEWLVNTWPPLEDQDLVNVVSLMLAKKRRTTTEKLDNKLQNQIDQEVYEKSLSVRTEEGKTLSNTVEFLVKTWPPVKDDDVLTVVELLLARKSRFTDDQIESLEDTVSCLKDKIHNLRLIAQEQSCIHDKALARERELKKKYCLLLKENERLTKAAPLAN
jgi:hypothetical protein